MRIWLLLLAVACGGMENDLESQALAAARHL